MITITPVLLSTPIDSNRHSHGFLRRFTTTKSQETSNWTQLMMYGMLLMRDVISIDIRKCHLSLRRRLGIPIIHVRRTLKSSKIGSLILRLPSLFLARLRLRANYLRWLFAIVIRRRDRRSWQTGRGSKRRSSNSNCIISRRSRRLSRRRRCRSKKGSRPRQSRSRSWSMRRRPAECERAEN